MTLCVCTANGPFSEFPQKAQYLGFIMALHCDTAMTCFTCHWEKCHKMPTHLLQVSRNDLYWVVFSCLQSSEMLRRNMISVFYIFIVVEKESEKRMHSPWHLLFYSIKLLFQTSRYFPLLNREIYQCTNTFQIISQVFRLLKYLYRIWIYRSRFSYGITFGINSLKFQISGKKQKQKQIRELQIPKFCPTSTVFHIFQL